MSVVEKNYVPSDSPDLELKKEAILREVEVSEENGYEVPLERNFTFLASLGLGFALLNSWTAMSASLPVVLSSGGSTAMVWGLLVSFVGTILMALSLAEICHVFPLSGGQYDWTYCLAPLRMKNGLSFYVGWMACAGWTSLMAAASSLVVALVLGVIGLWKETYEAQRWHVTLMILAIVLGASTLNTFGVRALPMIDRFAGSWSIIGIVVVCITLLACSSGEYQNAKSVFATFTNETGWPNGMAFIMGLLQSTLGLTAFDAASHMVEEMPQPSRNAPRVMVLAVMLGAATSWCFMVVLLFCLRDFEAVATSAAGPLLEIYHQATQSRAGATCLMIFNILSMALTVQAVNTVASRMLMSFARDHGLGPISRFIAPVHPTLKVPTYSILFVSVWVAVFSLIYLGSDVALNAILAGAILFVQISYAVPILLIFIRGGDVCYAGHSHRWSLGRWRRPVNAGALCFVLITSVCFVFPPALPVSGSTMNYAVVVFAIVSIACAATWFLSGRTQFHGPSHLEDRLVVAKNA